jgi:hypothetical protein
MTKKSKSEKRTRPVRLSPVLWETPASLYAVDSSDALAAVLRREGVPPDEWMSFLRNESNDRVALAEVQYYDGGALCVVCFGESLFDSDNVTSSQILTLTHEAVHVFQRQCDLMAEEAPGDEVQAYAIERITQTLIDALVSLKSQRRAINAPKTTEQPNDAAQ